MVANVVGVGGAKDVEQAVLVDGDHPVLPEAFVGETLVEVGPEREKGNANGKRRDQDGDQGQMRSNGSVDGGEQLHAGFPLRL